MVVGSFGPRDTRNHEPQLGPIGGPSWTMTVDDLVVPLWVFFALQV
jgi:hypothetical protein